MPSKNRDSQEIMRTYTLLGQRVAKNSKELAETSCMNPEVREIVAFIDAFNKLTGAIDFQVERAALIVLGQETWFRKELTDLALKVGDVSKHFDIYDDEENGKTSIESSE